MKRYITRVVVFLLAGMLVSCGGGGGDGSSGGETSKPPAGGTPGGGNGANPGNDNGGNPGNDNGGGTGTLPRAGARVEESDVLVALSGAWTQTNPRFGWSGGAAMQSNAAGATATFTFTGTSVTWIGARNRGAGIALVRVDGGPAREVDLFARPNEIRTPVITINDLTDGPHTLTIEVTGRQNPEGDPNAPLPGAVVVDAFDVQAPIVSHLQETDPDAVYSGSWTQDNSAAWSGGGVASLPDPPVGGARFTEAAGAKVTLTFHGTSITWQGGQGPDGGIARVQVDGGPAVEVDTYSPAQKFQEVLFKATGLADARHTLTIEATGRKNDASTGAKIVVDAFDVTTPGRRYQEDFVATVPGDPTKITYSGRWIPRNVNRVWSEGASATTQTPGATVEFHFTGTSVSWIGCQKESCGGSANIYIDNVFVTRVNNWKPVPIEGYQRVIFRKDGLSPGPHTLKIEMLSTGSYIVVDAFDVRP